MLRVRDAANLETVIFLRDGMHCTGMKVLRQICVSLTKGIAFAQVIQVKGYKTYLLCFFVTTLFLTWDKNVRA